MGEQIQGCFGDDMIGRLVVWASDKNWTYEEIVDKGVGFGIQESFNFSLEEVTDLDPVSFYNTFKDTDTPICGRIIGLCAGGLQDAHGDGQAEDCCKKLTSQTRAKLSCQQ